MEAKIFFLLLIVSMDIVSGVKQEQRPIPYKIWTLYRKLITPGSVMARSYTDCCYTVKVAFEYGNNTEGAYLARPEIYQDYEMEPGLVKNRTHYTSRDRKYALSFCGDDWWIQSVNNRGKCRGFAHSGGSNGPKCVHDIPHDWNYYAYCINKLLPAEQGLIVKCASQKW